MYASGIVTGAVLLFIIGAVNWFWLVPEKIAVGQWISAGLAALILLDVLVSPLFRYHRYRYSINDECIDIVEGYLFVKRNIVPIERLHKLQTAKGPFDQFFKVAKVVVTTGGGDVTISFLEEEKAEQIADSLRRRINEIVTEQRAENGKQVKKFQKSYIRCSRGGMGQHSGAVYSCVCPGTSRTGGDVRG